MLRAELTRRRRGWPARLLACALGACVAAACTSRAPKPSDRLRVDARGIGPGARGTTGGQGGTLADAGSADAARPRASNAGSADAGPSDASVAHDAGDATLACVPARCPVYTDAPLELSGFSIEQRACCIGADGEDVAPRDASSVGTCGLEFPDSYDTELGRHCEPLVSGERDDTCLDTLVDGVRVEGCRRPDGQCGHLTEGWGCHGLYRADWDTELVDETTTLPNPFNCTPAGQPCTRTTECCFHPNYGGVCWADSDAVADGGPLVGYCTNPEETSFEPTPLPRF